LCDFTNDMDQVSSLAWVQKGSTVAIGTKNGKIHIYDANKTQLLRSYATHQGRCGSMSWNGPILSSGSRDCTIQHRDVREASPTFRRLQAHKQEVCGVRWSPTELGGSGRGYLASGGNDNALLVWDSRWDSSSSSHHGADGGIGDGDASAKPLWKFRDHKAAVKAISWSPHMSGVLASGGGTADRKIITWNTVNGNMLHELDTGSQVCSTFCLGKRVVADCSSTQVCNLLWSQTTHELVSTHGYSSTSGQNQIIVWRYPSMSMLATLSGHTHRVLYLAMSPDGQTIVTGAGDETLRFWEVFPRGRTGEMGPGTGGGAGSPFTSIGKRRREFGSGRLEPGGQIR
jgi:cell division cycle 20-like protein 1 (cofactor of APC complex)